MSEARSGVTSSIPDGSRRPRRRVRVWHVAVILLLAAVTCLLVVRCHWRRQLRRRVEAFAAAGYPVTLEQLDASYEWPESGENAGAWILDACSYYIGTRQQGGR